MDIKFGMTLEELRWKMPLIHVNVMKRRHGYTLCKVAGKEFESIVLLSKEDDITLGELVVKMYDFLTKFPEPDRLSAGNLYGCLFDILQIPQPRTRIAGGWPFYGWPLYPNTVVYRRRDLNQAHEILERQVGQLRSTLPPRPARDTVIESLRSENERLKELLADAQESLRMHRVKKNNKFARTYY